MGSGPPSCPLLSSTARSGAPASSALLPGRVSPSLGQTDMKVSCIPFLKHAARSIAPNCFLLQLCSKELKELFSLQPLNPTSADLNPFLLSKPFTPPAAVSISSLWAGCCIVLKSAKISRQQQQLLPEWVKQADGLTPSTVPFLPQVNGNAMFWSQCNPARQWHWTGSPRDGCRY